MSAFSNETQMSIDERMKYDHGLIFDDTSGRDQNLVAADVKQWYKTHSPSDCLALGLLDVNPPLVSSHGYPYCGPSHRFKRDP